MNDDVNERVKEALERTDIMALSTMSSNGPWTSPVQFEYHQDLQLFFQSMPDARHVQNILRDPRVSAAIYSYPGPPGGNLGLQLRGTAERVGSEPDKSGWLKFKITPEEIWCFDSRVFGRTRRRVDISALRL